MVALSLVWSQAWALLDEEARSPMSTADGRLPADFFNKAVFSRVFPELAKELWSPSAIRSGSCDDDRASDIFGAVDARIAMLEQVGHLMNALKPALLDRGHTWTKERYPIARLAVAAVGSDDGAWVGGVSRASADALLDEAYATPVRDADGVRAALRDEELVAELEVILARDAPSATAHACGDADGCELDDLVEVYLAEKLVDITATPTGVDGSDAWQAVVGHPCLAGVHRSAAGLGLTAHVIVPVPAVREEKIEPEPLLWHQKPHLDSSLEARLAGGLRGDREQRRRLPDERELLRREARRAGRPLGLDDAVSWATLASARQVLIQLAADTAPNVDTVAGRVAGRFAGFRTELARVRGFAALPTAALNATEAPDLWYAGLLWRRLHGHETRGVLDRSAVAAHLLLTGIAVTVVDRIRESRKQMVAPIVEGLAAAGGPTVEDEVLRAAADRENRVPDLDPPATDARVTELFIAVGSVAGQAQMAYHLRNLFDSYRAAEDVAPVYADLIAELGEPTPEGVATLADVRHYLGRHAS